MKRGQQPDTVNFFSKLFRRCAVSNILVPIRLSEQASSELEDVAAIAIPLKAHVTLLHVVNLNLGPEELGIPRARLLQESCAAAEKILMELAQLLWQQGIMANTCVRVGKPVDEILGEAASRKADLIIMAGKHPTWYQRLFQRNVVQCVAEQARCPVMLLTNNENVPAINSLPADQPFTHFGTEINGNQTIIKA